MGDPPRYLATDEGHKDDDADVAPARASTTGTPRWVKVFGIVVVAAVLLFVVLMLTNNPGGHGSDRHSGGATGHQAPPTAGHTPPVQRP